MFSGVVFRRLQQLGERSVCQLNPTDVEELINENGLKAEAVSYPGDGSCEGSC